MGQTRRLGYLVNKTGPLAGLLLYRSLELVVAYRSAGVVVRVPAGYLYNDNKHLPVGRWHVGKVISLHGAS